MLPLIGGAISAIGSALGIASPIIGGILDRNAQEEANQRNADLQREFAQNGIKWRIDDAASRGISPLAALGASSVSSSPSYVGESGLGRGLSQMGQNVSRAAQAAGSYEQRISEQMGPLQLERAALENDLLRSRIAVTNQQLGPPMPLASNSAMPGLTGQGNAQGVASNSNNQGSAYVQESPLQRTHSSPGQPQQEVGAVPDYGFARTRHGYAIVPSKDVKEKIEDQFLPELAWGIRNQLLPNISASQGPAPPDPKYYPLPKGYDFWEWSTQHQEFRPGRRAAPPTMMEKVRQSFKPTL